MAEPRWNCTRRARRTSFVVALILACIEIISGISGIPGLSFHAPPQNPAPGRYLGSASMSNTPITDPLTSKVTSNYSSVADTLVLSNNTLVPGDYLATNGINPQGITYDNRKGEVFIGNSGSKNILVLSASNLSLVATIPLDGVAGLAYDGAKGEVFVSGYYGGYVKVISDTNNSVVATIKVNYSSFCPFSIAYDRGKGEIFVSQFAGNQISVINDTTDTISANITVGNEPTGVAYDGGMGEVFVANYQSGTISVVNDSTNRVSATIPVGNYPQGIAYDNAKGRIYATHLYLNNVSVISDSTNKVVATVTLSASTTTPDGITYDSSKGEIFVANYWTNTTSVISDANNSVVATIPVGSYPVGVFYIGSLGEILVTDQESNNILKISDSTNSVVAALQTGYTPYSSVYDSGKDEIFVGNYGCYGFGGCAGNLSVISGITDKIITNIQIGGSPFGITYDQARGEVFVANPDLKEVKVVSDSNNSVVANLSIPGASAVTYDPGKGEVYVTNFSFARFKTYLTAINDSTDSVVSSVPISSYAEDVVYDSGRGELFVVHQGGYPYGNVSIINDTTNKITAVVQVGYGPTRAIYDRATGEVFVSNTYSNNVSVINDTTNKVVSAIYSGDSPSALSIADPQGNLFVANRGDGNLSVVNVSTNKVIGSVLVGGDPCCLSYDSWNRNLYAANYMQGTISVIGVPPKLHNLVFEVTASGTPVLSPLGQAVPFNMSFAGTVKGGVPPFYYSWAFGDGNSGLGSRPTHLYKSLGQFLVNLTVTDARGTVVSANRLLVNVTAPIGLRNIVTTHKTTYTDSGGSCNVGGFVGTCYTIQQNFFLSNSTSPGQAEYWVQNVIVNGTTLTGDAAYAVQQIWRLTGFPGSPGATPLWNNHSSYSATNGRFYLNSSISGGFLHLSDAWDGRMFSFSRFPLPTGTVSYIDAGSGFCTPSFVPPPLLEIAGPAGSGSATFTGGSGTVTSSIEFGPGNSWDSNVAEASVNTTKGCPQPTISEYGFSMKWSPSSLFRGLANFRYHPGGLEEGVGFTVPNPHILAEAVSTGETRSGAVVLDQSYATRLNISANKTSLRDGHSVTFFGMVLSGRPFGVSSPGLSSPTYLEARLVGVTHGSLGLCISVSYSSSASKIEYWSSGTWVPFSSVSRIGNAVCGSPPLASISGTTATLIVIGEPTPEVRRTTFRRGGP